MSEVTTIGLDVAKNVFHAVCCDRHGKEIGRKALRRHQLLDWFAQRPACLIGMEACGGAHYWARQPQALGHEVRLIPAQYIKAYVRGNKNDYNDARAIALAPLVMYLTGLRFCAIKNPMNLGCGQ